MTNLNQHDAGQDLTKMITKTALTEALIKERSQRILDYDRAYPDVGMGMSSHMARFQAINSLKNEGLLPETYED